MRILLAVIQKELLLLFRDKAGLLVLFVMPAILVIVITLVQDNALTIMGNRDTNILLIDNDGQDLSRLIVRGLETADGVKVTQHINGVVPDRRHAMDLVSRGEYQVCLVLPSGMTENVQTLARQSVFDSLSDETRLLKKEQVPEIAVYFDPAVQGGFRSSIGYMLELMIYRLEVREKFSALANELSGYLQPSQRAALRPADGSLAPAVDDPSNWSEASLLRIREGQVRTGGRIVYPTAVQQNVPAWTLFGVFFIVLPMAGAFIQERFNGIHHRLLTLPVSHLVLMLGRIIAFMAVCLGQCALIGFIGIWLLPMWGAAPLEMAGSVTALIVIGISAITAACGYGILLGTVVNSFEQAAMFGPISIVVAAAMGGIMVPVYAMPVFMQKMSILSPLAWGLNGTLDVFTRGGAVADVLPESGALFLFFVSCLALAWFWRYRHW